MSLGRPGSPERASAPPAGPPSGPLLSHEESAARARPLRAWGAADRDRVARAIAAADLAWRDAWGVGGDAADGGVRCRSPLDAASSEARPAAAWRPLGAPDAGVAWRLSPAETAPADRGDESPPRAALSSALFGPSRAAPPPGAARVRDAADPTLAEELAGAAWADWCARVSASLGAGAGAPARDARAAPAAAAWSGALVVTVPWCARSLDVRVEGDVVAALVATAGPAPAGADRSAPPLTSILEALSRRRARVRAELAPFELELGALAALRAGDVVRTAHRLETPLTVTVDAADGRPAEPVCAGFLGKAGAARAVELMASGTAAPATSAAAAAPVGAGGAQ